MNLSTAFQKTGVFNWSGNSRTQGLILLETVRFQELTTVTTNNLKTPRTRGALHKHRESQNNRGDGE